ncbi:hypothetical protein FOYG_12225 [Fusarium oxysporum NRRL 32931]|uniref:Uncharacterized protein n=1 Tax=Fusarium oxysporum NRRL 32931 TaxID=660029 RepID=W9HVM1_FUSOX|nr:hypothetical protein FOYG_12225 [Fusarium oxysporum NRRL 32931]
MVPESKTASTQPDALSYQRHLHDIFTTSSRHLHDIFTTSSRHLHHISTTPFIQEY